jgi:AraC family transcriptional activator of tynA and feaB
MIQHREIRFSAHFCVGAGTYLRRRLRAGRQASRMSSFNGTGPAGSIAEAAAVEMMMHLSVDVAGTSELNFEAWRALLRSTCGGKPQAIEPNDFVGWMRPRSVYRLTAAALKIHCGFAATDHGCSAYRYERTHRDVRLSGVDSYCALFQIASRRAVIQNDQTVQLAEGDIALLDGGQPATYVSENGSERWLALYLPRQALISHLGFEPQGVLHGRGGTLAARGLRRLVLDSIEDEEPMSRTAVSYMQLALYDLLGALFAPSDPWPVSRHADKLFTRICGVIKDRFADPDFGPCEVAAEAGISLRYLQKLFTQRGSTCSEFIYSLRLDSAARLLHRRASLDTGQPLSEIAYACGFRDYTNFARKFRHRFGRSPCAYAGDHT